MKKPLRVGIIGMGGFAGTHHNTLVHLEAAGECRLVCTCDPRMESFAERQIELRFPERGVKLFDDYLAMLDACGEELDVVFIPTPVPLHAPMHRACVERGIPVYLEKPPTLNYAELEEMLAVEERATKLTQVGFNFIVEQPRQTLKKRIVAGEFGAVRQACFTGLWPRGESYYARANWAGKLMLDGKLVLDSCLGNALAHFAHNVLFWCGPGEVFSWGRIAEVEAELYRAHRIEGTDTVFVKAATEHGPEIRIAMSHACDGAVVSREFVVCDQATITYAPGGATRIEWDDGHVEQTEGESLDLVAANQRAYFNYLRGNLDRPITRLIDSRPFVELNDLAYIASGRITTAPEPHIERASPPNAQPGHAAIRGVEAIAGEFVRVGLFPSAQKTPWAAPGGKATPSELGRLSAVVAKMVAERGS